MEILFVHRAFPAQFGRLALELTRQYNWRCHFLVEHLSYCPPPSEQMLTMLDVKSWPGAGQAGAENTIPWPQTFGHALQRAHAVHEAVRARPDLRPDLVVAHGGLVPTLLLRDPLTCPFVDYCEYYFSSSHCDLTYRLDLPAVESAELVPRCLNAATLLNLEACDFGYSPTHWQRQTFPERFWPRIEVHHDGIDTQTYRPRHPPKPARFGIPSNAQVVTFVARGLESMRGFDLFLEVTRRIARDKPNTHFVVVGGESTHYGWDLQFTGGASFKNWVLSRYQGDLSHFHFLGMIEPDALAEVFSLSDLHLYLSVPFVLSWSLLNAMACECLVLAGDVAPVHEVIEPSVNGLIEPLFDVERLAQVAVQVLDHPAEYAPLRRAARQLMEERYSLEIATRGLKDYFERSATVLPRAKNR